MGLKTPTSGSLYAFSAHVVPDLPDDGSVTGWWTGPDATARLSEVVSGALDGGDDWVYAGFGSMDQGDPTVLLELLGSACERVGVRAVVQVAGLRGSPHPRLLCVGDEPHDALFPRVRAVVHHGGAGTTGTVVRAGVPSVVVPHFADQFYWGRRLHLLGVAPRPLPRAFTSERALARRIDDALGQPMARRAARLSDRVAGEDGCGRAVRQVEEWLTGARGR